MFDGHIDNPAALAGLVFCLLVAAAALWRARAGLPGGSAGSPVEPPRLALYGGLILAAIWLVLAPLNLVNKATGGGLVLVFGAEGMDTGVVEYLTVAQWAACVVLFALLARRERGLLRLVAVLGAAAAWDPLESTCRHASLSIL